MNMLYAMSEVANQVFDKLSTSLAITIAGVLVLAFARSIVGIFKLGVSYKSNFATKEELKSLKEEITNEIRSVSSIMQSTITTNIMTLINEKLAILKDFKREINEVIAIKSEIKAELKQLREKYDEMRSMSDRLRTLENRIARLENTTSTTSDRRGE